MRVAMKSPLSGKVNTLDLDITDAQWASWHKNGGTLKAQEAFPHLTAGEREFLMTGITSQEWDATFSEEGEDEDYDGECDIEDEALEAAADDAELAEGYYAYLEALYGHGES